VHAIGDWPVVRFTIPQIFRTGGQARGEVYRDDESLIVEFEEFWGMWKSELKEVRIPFPEITSLSCQGQLTPGLHRPGESVWKGRQWKGLAEWIARAIRLFKLREIEKGKGLLGVVVEAPDGCGRAGRLHTRQQVNHRIADRGQHLRRAALADPAAVLAQRHVPDIVESVLDPPVPARQPQQLLGVGFVLGETRDPVDHLVRGFSVQRPLARQLEALLQSRPLLVQRQQGRRAQRALLDAAVPLVRGLSGPFRRRLWRQTSRGKKRRLAIAPPPQSRSSPRRPRAARVGCP